ncbi:hypothetical protein Q0P11_14800, partial [Staphylococcus aureus]|nr:hypothetical protein [Staphylococcus aureus]
QSPCLKSYAQEKFELINRLISRDNNLLNISWLCKIAQVSRSGFYAWKQREEKRMESEKKDEKDFELVLAAFNKRGYSKG